MLIQQANGAIVGDGERCVGRVREGAQVSRPRYPAVGRATDVDRVNVASPDAVSPGNIDRRTIVWVHSDGQRGSDSLLSERGSVRPRYDHALGDEAAGQSVGAPERLEGGSRRLIAHHHDIAGRHARVETPPSEVRGIDGAIPRKCRSDRGSVLAGGVARLEPHGIPCRAAVQRHVDARCPGRRAQVIVADVDAIVESDPCRLHKGLVDLRTRGLDAHRRRRPKVECRQLIEEKVAWDPKDPRIERRSGTSGGRVGDVPGSHGPGARDDVPQRPGLTVILGDKDGGDSALRPLRVRGERGRGHFPGIRRMDREERLAVLILLATQRRGNHIHDPDGRGNRPWERGRPLAGRRSPTAG